MGTVAGVTEAFFAVLCLLADAHPLEIFHSDAVGSLRRYTSWGSVAQSLDSHISDDVTSATTAARQDVAVFLVGGALRFLATLLGRLRNHEGLPQEVAFVVKVLIPVLRIVLRAEFACGRLANGGGGDARQAAIASGCGEAAADGYQLLLWLSSCNQLAPFVPTLLSSLAIQPASVARACGDAAFAVWCNSVLPEQRRAAAAACFAQTARAAVALLLNVEDVMFSMGATTPIGSTTVEHLLHFISTVGPLVAGTKTHMVHVTLHLAIEIVAVLLHTACERGQLSDERQLAAVTAASNVLLASQLHKMPRIAHEKTADPTGMDRQHDVSLHLVLSSMRQPARREV